MDLIYFSSRSPETYFHLYLMIGLDMGTKYVEMYLFKTGPKLGFNAHTCFWRK